MTAPVAAAPGLPPVPAPRREIPRQDDDHTAAAARRRLAFLTEMTGVTPEHLGRYGPGRVRKFAEIVAATVLCGEVSLGAAVVAGEWVTAHERLGRNRR
jgi:hypothetical protein